MSEPGARPDACAERLVVAAALVDDLNSPSVLLAARRTRPAHLAGRWELPGGKVEPGEDPVAALHRELREELGVTVELGAEIRPPQGAAFPLERGWSLRAWPAVVLRGLPSPTEVHDEVRVLGVGRWFEVAWLPGDVPVVEALLTSVRAAPGDGSARRTS